MQNLHQIAVASDRSGIPPMTHVVIVDSGFMLFQGWISVCFSANVAPDIRLRQRLLKCWLLGQVAHSALLAHRFIEW